MQSLNEKPYSLHFTTKKFNSCDDCKEEFKVAGIKRLNQLKTLPESFLARRRLQTGFSLTPINTKLNKRKYSSCSFNEILHEMKAKVLNRDNISYGSHCHGDEDYLFVNPQISNPYPKQDKELRISSFLNSLGIFQLNLGVALKDYNY